MISYDPNRMGPWSDFSPPVPRLLTLYVMNAEMNAQFYSHIFLYCPTMDPYDMIKLLNEMVD